MTKELQVTVLQAHNFKQKETTTIDKYRNTRSTVVLPIQFTVHKVRARESYLDMQVVSVTSSFRYFVPGLSASLQVPTDL